MQRIAIVGSGIAGLGTAWLLDGKAEITVFEAANRAGGHANTVMAGEQPVDTGFIVLNDRNYPFFESLLAELDVETRASDMSFAVSIGDGAIEWAGDSWRTLFAQKSRLFDQRHWRMIGDILRFNRQCREDKAAGLLAGISIGNYLKLRGFSGQSGIPAFRYEWPGHSQHDVRPDSSQWSAPPPGNR